MRIPSKLYYLKARLTNENGKIPILPRYKRGVRSKFKMLKIKKHDSYNQDYINKSREFLSKNFKGYKDLSWNKYYSFSNGKFDCNYIPRDLYTLYIEPNLNNHKLATATSDKCFLDILFGKDSVLPFIGKFTNKFFYDENNLIVSKEKLKENILSSNKNIVAKKAIGSAQGRGVFFLSPKECIDFLDNLKQNETYVFQFEFKQAKELANFHPSSLNTVRVTSLRLKDKIVICSCYFRLGKNNSRVDNASARGIYCGVSKEGVITEKAYDNHCNTYDKHPTSNVEFKNFKIPNFEKIKDFTIKKHHYLQNFSIVSWDITLDESLEPKIVEINLKDQAVNPHQVANGALFGEYTEEVLELLRDRENSKR
ncbi:MAG: hypothetical protein CR982_02330 [Candidatus Cloacimonadota bacterium]|nr:MAG: hypothetical protein CR982_02330 [Candidatus Cloacimonadota bacterium]PIE81091.1 MAG: hypothetical protein CSA15_01060 [Candidatus Delongbacteria bacterium]